MISKLLQAFVFGVAPLGLAGLVLSGAQNPNPAAPSVDFASEVLPIFKASCFGCHGEEKQRGGLRMDSRESLLKGGDSGPAVIPGNSAKSPLILRVTGVEEPRMPMGQAPLSKAQIATLKQWIDQGAAWGESSGKHWAYVRPVRPKLPVVKNKTWARNPIDFFILARLEKEGLSPSPEASKETLIRRVSLDLIGLPPTPEEVRAFLADSSPNAYEKLVDRLLASPHYGERQARIWLDLARYADTNGYEKDERRSIWLYRDWVIQAFNQNMPFDQFTIEQIAGDMLPNASQSQRIATGFHRNTMKNEEGGVDVEEQRWLTLVDRVGVTGTVWLSSTLACAQCHDHKYDPISQREFYELLAFFDNCDEPTLDTATSEQLEQRKKLQEEQATLEAELKKDGLDSMGQQEINQRLQAVKKQMEATRAPTTLVFQEKSGEPRTFVRKRGEFLSKEEEVTANTPAVLNPMPVDAPSNRLGLAQWLVSKNNPLTARAQVNRYWEQYFGHGIVETTEDFGLQGAKPTHPELLDWLATEFVRIGWDVKAMHRLIVTSATYRQSSSVSPLLLERDPQNKLYARGPRFRMEAEMIRDSALRAAGLLNLKMGGPSVFPYQPDGIWDVPYSADRWVVSEGAEKHRRGIYTFWRRSAPYPAFINFDATSREFCTVRRPRANTPLQALTTLNDPSFMEAARGLAQRLMKEGGASPTEKVKYAFMVCLSRAPKPEERRRLLAFYEQMNQRYQTDRESAKKLASAEGGEAEWAAWTMVANVMMNLDEFLTKE